DDPLRQGLALLGAARPNEWLRPDAWAKLAGSLGLVRRLIGENDRENDTSRERGIGVTLSAHRDETFVAEIDGVTVTLCLEKKRRRFDGEEGHVRYRFVTLAEEQ